MCSCDSSPLLLKLVTQPSKERRYLLRVDCVIKGLHHLLLIRPVDLDLNQGPRVQKSSTRAVHGLNQEIGVNQVHPEQRFREIAPHDGGQFPHQLNIEILPTHALSVVDDLIVVRVEGTGC